MAKAGIEPLVLERRPVVDSEAGSWFTLAPNGLDALQAIDALAAAEEGSVPSRANVMYGATGRRLGEVSLGNPLENGLVGLTMKRSLLAARLEREAERRGIVVRGGADVAEVSDAGDHVEATLTDGNVLTADLLVGADGFIPGPSGHRFTGARSPLCGPDELRRDNAKHPDRRRP